MGKKGGGVWKRADTKYFARQGPDISWGMGKFQLKLTSHYPDKSG